MEFHEKMRSFGISKYGSVNKFAEALGISQPNLSQYLGGKHKPGITLLIKLANIGCDLNWLFCEDDTPPQHRTDETLELQKRLDELKREVETLESVLSPQMVEQLKALAKKKK